MYLPQLLFPLSHLVLIWCIILLILFAAEAKHIVKLIVLLNVAFCLCVASVLVVK